MAFNWYAQPMRVTLDRAGRIVVPKRLRDRLGLQPGTQLDAEVEGGRLVATPVGPQVKLVEEGGRLVAQVSDPGPGLTIEDIRRLVEEDRDWRRS